MASGVEGMVSVATYDRRAEPAPEEAPARTDYTPLAVAGGIIAAEAVALAGFWLTRRIRLCERLDDGSVRIVEKMKPVSDGPGRIVEARSSIDLGKPYFLDVPGKYARKKGRLEVRANGRTVYIGPWAKHIDIRPV